MFITLRKQLQLKRTVYIKMNILSSFTHPHVVPNIYEFIYSVEHKRRYFEKAKLFWLTLYAKTVQTFSPSKYLLLCSTEERTSYRFIITREWVNDKIKIFVWTLPLNTKQSVQRRWNAALNHNRLYHSRSKLQLNFHRPNCFQTDLNYDQTLTA